jgi:hypothetical protein
MDRIYRMNRISGWELQEWLQPANRLYGFTEFHVICTVFLEEVVSGRG